jgi:hypothetical protein
VSLAPDRPSIGTRGAEGAEDCLVRSTLLAGESVTLVIPSGVATTLTAGVTVIGTRKLMTSELGTFHSRPTSSCKCPVFPVKFGSWLTRTLRQSKNRMF